MLISSFLSNKTLQERGEHDICSGLDVDLSNSGWVHAMLWMEADTAFVSYYGPHPEDRNIQRHP